jgi:hypothetical protein
MAQIDEAASRLAREESCFSSDLSTYDKAPQPKYQEAKSKAKKGLEWVTWMQSQ